MKLATTIKMLKKGDQAAFRELVFTYTGKLMVVAKIYTENIQDAQDSLQDGFIKIFQNISKFDSNQASSFLPWMRKIVMNEALSRYRKKSYKMEGFSLDIAREPSVDPICFKNFEKEDLLKAIQNLPLRSKQVVCLFALEGYSHKEISVMLNIESSTSRALYSRAKVMLSKTLKSQQIIHEDVTQSTLSFITSTKMKSI